MLTSSRSVSPEIRSVPPVIRPDSSQLVSSKNASHQIPVQIFEGHGKWVRCVYFYPDEKKLVTGSHEETLRVWNRMTKVEEVLSGHTGSVQDLDVSRDGKMIVSGSKDKTVRIWNGESGETMHIFKGHEHEVNSVQFSPDASRVVSGSSDSTVQVWSVETGELAFEPIKSHGRASCVRYSPIGDRIASGARTIQIWNAETGSGILSIKNSWVCSLAWTADGTHIIGGCWGEVTIWNSHDGERLHTWKLKPGNQSWIALSLSPTGTHVATSCWNENTALVIDISTGEQKAALKHNKSVYGIAYSPSGRFIATVCNDGNVYLWDAPAVEDPPPKSPKPPFSSFLDRPAVPLARPSGNDRRGLDAFWDTLPNRVQHAPPQPQRVFHKVRNTFANVFTRRLAGATQTIPRSSVRDTVEPVEVAAGRDNTFWVVVLIPTYNAIEKILYTLIHCRKPEDPDEELPATTRTNSSQTTIDNVATTNQSGHSELGDGTENTPTVVGNLVIRTQPQRTPDMLLSGETSSAEPYSSESLPHNSQICDQPEGIEMVAMPETSTALGCAPPLPIPLADPLSFAATSHEPSSSSMAVTSAQLSTSSNSSHSPFVRFSSHAVDDLVTVTVSRAEWASLQDIRRRSQTTSTFVRKAADPLRRPGHDHESAVYPSTSLPRPPSPAYVTQNTSPIQCPPSPQPGPHIYAQPSRSLVGLDPLLHVVPSLLSSSPLSAPVGHSHHLRPPPTTNAQSLGLHLIAPSDDARAEAPPEPAAQLAIRQPTSDDKVD